MWISVDNIDLYLIECPFCGRAKLEMMASPTKDAELLIYRVQCLRCFAIGPGELNEFKAASVWNKRS